MSQEFVKTSVAQLPLWQRYSEQFPVCDNLLYLNHAAVAPPPRATADALKHLADDGLHWGSFHYPEWLATYDALRANAARLLKRHPSEIALGQKHAQGI